MAKLDLSKYSRKITHADVVFKNRKRKELENFL